MVCSPGRVCSLSYFWLVFIGKKPWGRGWVSVTFMVHYYNMLQFNIGDTIYPLDMRKQFGTSSIILCEVEIVRPNKAFYLL